MHILLFHLVFQEFRWYHIRQKEVQRVCFFVRSARLFALRRS